jgi:hypothetical protein
MSDALSLNEPDLKRSAESTGLIRAAYTHPTDVQGVVIPTEWPSAHLNLNDRTVYAADSPEAKAYEAVVHSMVRIDAGPLLQQPAGQPAGLPLRGYGSGFIIDTAGTISTDDHVVDDVNPNGIKVWVNNAWHSAQLISETKSNDSAKLRVVPNYYGEQFTPVKLAAPGEHSQGHHYVFGYVGMDNTLFMAVDDRKYPTSDLMHLNQIDGFYAGTGYQPEPGEDPNRTVIQSDMVAGRGMSGGPYVNSQGKVEGRDFASDLLVGGYTYLTPIDDLSYGQRTTPAPIPLAPRNSHVDVQPPAGAAAAVAKGLTF